jgi:ADP-ribose pyrophosphatase YjhB (NUDIX family)
MPTAQVLYCPHCGNKLKIKTRAGRKRPVCVQCDWVYFPDPKVAVVAVVRVNKKILLTRRVNTPQKGLWTFPGGFVDAGEDPARAAERECLEETGLTVRVTDLLDVISGQEHPRGAHILIVYQAVVQSGQIKPGDDADKVDFFSLDQLPALAFRSTQKIMDKIDRY